MKVNNISNVSFQRAIQLDSNTNSYTDWRNGKVDSETYSVISAMTRENNFLYDKETSKKIGEFLRAQIGDYDKKSGVQLRKFDGHLYLFTGNEALEMTKIDNEAIKRKRSLEAWVNNGEEGAMSAYEKAAVTNDAYIRAKKREIVSKRKRAALKMVEDGQNGKPYTKLTITKHPELKNSVKIEYYSTLSMGKTSRVYKTLYV